jgi:3',5'-cyclic-AMP phosphodiesterase
MASTVIAHLTDAHLDQKLVLGEQANSIEYRHEPDQHRERLRIVIDDIARRGISNIVFGGDIGAKTSTRWFFETLDHYCFKLRLVLGNHDTFAAVASFYRGKNASLADQLYYSCEEADLKSIFLDTSANFVGDRQLAWLQSELDDKKKTFVVFAHHPILQINTPLDRIGVALRDRDDVHALLRGARGRVVIFCGHYHMNVETTDTNIQQFLTPAICYQIIEQADPIAVDDRSFGYRILRLDGAEIVTEVVTFSQRQTSRRVCHGLDQP